MSDRWNLFYELTNSLCATCYRKVAAKVVVGLALSRNPTGQTSAARRRARNE